MNYGIERNGLHFAFTTDGYICQELEALPQSFAEKWSEQEVRAAIEEHVQVVRSGHTKRCETKEEYDKTSPVERTRLGMEIFDGIILTIRESVANKKMSLMDELLFWMSDWWYYHLQMRAQLTRTGEAAWDRTFENARVAFNKFLLPLLPEPVQKLTREGCRVINQTVGFGHFAVLLSGGTEGPHGCRRYVVTDTQLIELRDVGGYNYLDIQPNGKPITRCCCPHGGERAFFDGVRLMAHDQFQTCAPKTVIIDGGYKVNSTRCTIVNGMLFPLIDVDDAVAYTTGAFMGMVDFNVEEAINSYETAEKSGGRMRVSNGKVSLDGRELKPVGFFEPSKLSLQPSGFTLCGWSVFQELPNLIYQHILVVDDKQEWIDQTKEAFGGQVEHFEEFCTTDKQAALERILLTNPQAVLLDVHLTPDEEFDGLLIANQLAKRNFEGLVLLCSSYRDEALASIRNLVRGKKVVAPGKNLDKIRRYLQGK